MTPNKDVDTQRTTTLINLLERLDRASADCGRVTGLIEPPQPTNRPTQSMTATWGS